VNLIGAQLLDPMMVVDLATPQEHRPCLPAGHLSAFV
jgi:hypothetical protein